IRTALPSVAAARPLFTGCGLLSLLLAFLNLPGSLGTTSARRTFAVTRRFVLLFRLLPLRALRTLPGTVACRRALAAARTLALLLRLRPRCCRTVAAPVVTASVRTRPAAAVAITVPTA